MIVMGASLKFVVPALAILLAMTLALVRALRGPTVFDRALAANMIGALAVLLLAVIGFLTERPEFLDLGITYGVLNLIGTLAVLKFFRYRDLGFQAEDIEATEAAVIADQEVR